jgi:quercetin dioxygenase-like cupin family protein
MRTTVFTMAEGEVTVSRSDAPPWADPDDNGQVAAEVHRSPNGTTVFYHIPIGCSVPVHAGPNYSVCQIVTGRGKLVLPSGQEIDYQGPELYVFEPGALHGWRDVVEDTMLTVADVKG